MKKFLAFALFVSAIMITACTDGSIIGSDLLGDEEISLQYNDDFLLSGQTVLGDSIATYSINTTNQTYMLGQVDEPIFGKYSSDIYTGFTFSTGPFPNFRNSVLDSIVLDLEYDSLGFYGDQSVVHNIEVFKVTEDILELDTIYSNQTFDTDMVSLGQVSLVPNINDNRTVSYRDFDFPDSTIVLSPRLRVRLDNSLGEELILDTISQGSIEDLEANFKGLYIKSTTEGSSMIGLNFSENSDFNDGVARMHVYFTKTADDGTLSAEEYSYFLRPQTASNFIHDYSGSVVETALDEPDLGDDFLYCHNMAGVNAEINFPDLNFLDDNNNDTIIVNSAQIVLTVIEDNNQFDTDLYPPAAQFIMSKDNENGEGRILIDDIIKDGIDLTTGLLVHDGVVRSAVDENGNDIKTVTFNITTYVQNLLKNDITSSKVTISPIGRSESPRRTVFYGLNHPDYPAKLRIAYTKI